MSSFCVHRTNFISHNCKVRAPPQINQNHDNIRDQVNYLAPYKTFTVRCDGLPNDITVAMCTTKYCKLPIGAEGGLPATAVTEDVKKKFKVEPLMHTFVYNLDNENQFIQRLPVGCNCKFDSS